MNEIEKKEGAVEESSALSQYLPPSITLVTGLVFPLVLSLLGKVEGAGMISILVGWGLSSVFASIYLIGQFRHRTTLEQAIQRKEEETLRLQRELQVGREQLEEERLRLGQEGKDREKLLKDESEQKLGEIKKAGADALIEAKETAKQSAASAKQHADEMALKAKEAFEQEIQKFEEKIQAILGEKELQRREGEAVRKILEKKIEEEKKRSQQTLLEEKELLRREQAAQKKIDQRKAEQIEKNTAEILEKEIWVRDQTIKKRTTEANSFKEELVTTKKTLELLEDRVKEEVESRKKLEEKNQEKSEALGKLKQEVDLSKEEQAKIQEILDHKDRRIEEEIKIKVELERETKEKSEDLGKLRHKVVVDETNIQKLEESFVEAKATINKLEQNTAELQTELNHTHEDLLKTGKALEFTAIREKEETEGKKKVEGISEEKSKTIGKLEQKIEDLKKENSKSVELLDKEIHRREEAEAKQIVFHEENKRLADAIAVSGGQLSAEVEKKKDLAVIIEKKNEDLAKLRHKLGMRKGEFLQLQRDMTEIEENIKVQLQDKIQFLSIVGKGLRKPLNRVLATTSTLRKVGLSEEELEALRGEEGKRESSLSNIYDILDLSRIGAGELTIDPLKFNLKHTLEDLSNEFSFRLGSKDIELATSWNIPESRVWGDPGRLRQIINTLLENSLESSFENGDSGKIYLRANLEKEDEFHHCLRFEVEDTGKGINQEEIDSILKPFKQGAKFYKNKCLNVRLLLVHELVQLMKGDFGVESEEGKGVTFWFTVNLVKTDLSLLEEKIRDISLKGKRVLHIDASDSKNIVEGFLQFWNCETTFTESGLEAIELLKKSQEKKKFDFVLVGYFLQEMGGIEFGQQMKKQKLNSMPMVLLKSSFSMRGDGALARDNGFTGFLTGRYSQQDLYSCLKKSLDVKGKGEVYPDLISRHSLKDQSERKHILLVEDNIADRKSIRKLIEQNGHHCDIAKNGAEGVEIAAKSDYDLIFMDFKMPEMGGVDATKEIRKQQKEKGKAHNPIIGMLASLLYFSDDAIKKDQELCLDAGMDAYMNKPVNSDVFREILTKWSTKLM